MSSKLKIMCYAILAMLSFSVGFQLFAFYTLVFTKYAGANADGALGLAVRISDYGDLWRLNLEGVSYQFYLSMHVISFAFILAQLSLLIQFFRNFVKGNIFKNENYKLLSKLGWLFLFVATFGRVIQDAMTSMAKTFSNPPGERLLSISFGNYDFQDILIGLMLIVAAKVMSEATDLYNDQKLTV